MVEVARFFDAVSYGEGDQAEVQARMVRDQVCAGVGGQLQVSSGGVGFANVAAGEAFVQGFWYKNDAVKSLPISANAGATARVDLVVLRLDRTGNSLTAVVKEGVVGGGAPTLTQVVGGPWEFPIASISTASNASTFTDLRVLQSVIYNPMTSVGDLMVGGAGGVPTRQPVGPASRVFGVNAAGVLGYYQVDSAMLTDNSIGGGDINTGAVLNIGGLSVGAGANFAGDITAYRAGAPTTGVVYFGNNSGTRYIYYDGTNFQVSGPINVGNISIAGTVGMPANSITTAMIAGSSISQYVQGAVFSGTGGTAAAWAYAGGYVDVGVNATTDLIFVCFQGTVANNSGAYAAYFAISAPWVTTSPLTQMQMNTGVAGGSVSFFMSAVLSGYTGTQRFHAIYGAQGGQTITFLNSFLWVLVLRR